MLHPGPYFEKRKFYSVTKHIQEKRRRAAPERRETHLVRSYAFGLLPWNIKYFTENQHQTRLPCYYCGSFNNTATFHNHGRIHTKHKLPKPQNT